MSTKSLSWPRRLTSLPTLLAEPARFRALVIVNAALLWLIIPSGGLVRLTGSGLGCPDWPLCDGGIVPESGYHATIEYSNRIVSAFIIAVTVITWLTARHLHGARRTIQGLALAVALMSIGQIPLGAVTVLSGLHPLMVSGHFLLSLAALAAGVLLVLAVFDEAAGRRRGWDHRRGPFSVLGAAALLAVIVTGVLVTAAGPHSGDDDVLRRFGDLEGAAWLHVRAVAVLVVLMVVLAVWLYRERPADPSTGRLITILLPLLAAQIAIGEVQYRSSLPWQVVAVHVAVAGLVWAAGIALTWVVARPPLPAPGPDDAAPLETRQPELSASAQGT